MSYGLIESALTFNVGIWFVDEIIERARQYVLEPVHHPMGSSLGKKVFQTRWKSTGGFTYPALVDVRIIVPFPKESCIIVN